MSENKLVRFAVADSQAGGQRRPFAKAVRAGDFVYVSGQVPTVDGEVVTGGIVAQTEQVVANIKDVLALADCTLAEIGGTWWMFANSPVPGASYWDELHLFHAPSPIGPWTPHRLNPVVSDVRTARPAGALFQRGGAWYRPSQDSSGGYGSATNIQRIVRLDEHHYEEATVARLLPQWQPGLTGVHTVNALGGLTVIDVKRRIGR